MLMLSGRRDSFLAACHLLENPDNCLVKMVTFYNGCSYQSINAGKVADCIISKYGKALELRGGLPIWYPGISELFKCLVPRRHSRVMKKARQEEPMVWVIMRNCKIFVSIALHKEKCCWASVSKGQNTQRLNREIIYKT